MKYKKNLSYLLSLFITLFFSCGDDIKQENNNITPASSLPTHAGNEDYLAIDKNQTVVIWEGSSVQGKHDGYAYVLNGEVKIENGLLTGGTIEMDMNKTEGPGHDKTNNLIDHLKGPDFFDVAKFPVSTFTITAVESLNAEDKKISGDLTIKGITHPVSFPAKVELKDQTFKANGKLVIDRTLWGVRYNSGKFFDNLKDQAISDSVAFTVRIVANK